MFLERARFPAVFVSCRRVEQTRANKKAGGFAGLFSEVARKPRDAEVQHSALPQRAMPIFSFSPSSPTAPITICLPMT